MSSAVDDNGYDRVDSLIRRLGASEPSDDLAALGGELGLAWLELFERDGDDDAFRAGVGCLRRTAAESSMEKTGITWRKDFGK